MSEENIWKGRQSLRPFVPKALLSITVAWAGYYYAGAPLQAIIDATLNILPWTDAGVLRVWNALRIASFVPLALTGLSAAKAWSTRYQLTSERLIYSRGILLRKQDQIALQRIRDFRIMRPAMARLTGTGVVHIISRDETLPHLEMGPFGKPDEIEGDIRRAVGARQEATGYRELETT